MTYKKVVLLMIFTLIVGFVSINILKIYDYTSADSNNHRTIIVYMVESSRKGHRLEERMRETKEIIERRLEKYNLMPSKVRVKNKILTITIEQEEVDRMLLAKLTKQKTFKIAHVLLDKPGQLVEVGMESSQFNYKVLSSRKHIIKAKEIEEPDGSRSIQLQLNPEGKEKFYNATKEGGQLAYILNDRVISAPRILFPIESGKVVISGDFTHLQVKRMVELLNAPKLPSLERISIY